MLFRSMAEWEGERLTVHIGSQNPQGTRDTLAGSILKMPPSQIRVLVRDIGGGFGMKTGIQPDEAVPVWAAKKLKRPVRWHAERSEEFAAATAGRDQIHKMSMALDKDCRITALRMEAFAKAVREGFEGTTFDFSCQGSLFWIHPLANAPIRSIGAIPSDLGDRFAPFFRAALERGVYLPPNGYEVGFLSLAHTPEILQTAAKALSEAARAVGSQ